MNKKAQPPPRETVTRLRRLINRHQRAKGALREAEEALYLAVYEILETEDVSIRGLAAAVGVPPSTVKDWKHRGKHIVEKDRGPGV